MTHFIIILIPITVAVVAQVIKACIDGIMGRFNFSSLYELGGMPSGHSAFVTSTVTILGLVEGFESPVFMLSIIVAIIVIRDALTLRQRMSEQSKVLNQIIKQLPDDTEYRFPVLHERIGHSTAQVVGGVITGLVLTGILYLAILLT